MHELSLATEIIDLVGPQVPEGEQLETVRITVGPLSGVCTESLNFCFTELARQEGFAGARLKINSVPARFHCLGCNSGYETDDVEDVCPACASMQRRILGGTEFTVDYIELADQGENHV